MQSAAKTSQEKTDMATDGTPEMAAKRCGEAIARLRTMRRWSRAQLLIRLYDELTPDDPNYDSVSETWLARLENGRMVKVPRQTVEALCRALRCTPQQRAWVLLCADRNVLAEDISEPTEVAEVLTYAMDRLYCEAYEALRGLIGQRDVSELDDVEIFEVTATALNLLLSRRTQRQTLAAHAHALAGGRHSHVVPREGRIAPAAAQAARTGAASR
jgi:transcriptional regulator with XRE-family HTH domain